MGRLAKVARTGSAPNARSRAVQMAHGRGPQGEVASRARASEYTETDPGTNQQLVEAQKTPVKSGAPGDQNTGTMKVPGRFEGNREAMATGPLAPGTVQGKGRNNPKPETSAGAHAGDQNTGSMAAPDRFVNDRPEFSNGAFTQPMPTVEPSQRAKSGAEVRTGDGGVSADGVNTPQSTSKKNSPHGTYPGSGEMKSNAQNR